MGGNYSAFNSFDNTGYLQNYIEEQIKKKRSKLNHYSSDKNYGNILCCSIKEGSFLKPVHYILKISSFF